MGINAERFINSYNTLDKTLRDLYNIKPNLTFSDTIRKVASVNSVVKKHEDDLIDYGRLRNAIVHRSISGEVIAEPHDDVVLKLEAITRQVKTPPRAMDSVVNRKVFVVDGAEKIKNLLMEMYKSGYSNIPVYRSGTLVGVVSRKMLVEAMGKAVMQENSIDEFLNKSVMDSLDLENISSHYDVVPASITIDNLLYLFQQNRKLSTVIITKTGSYSEQPLGIVVTADTIDMQTILDNY
ncbi:MAG: CBS domain-containing protein [Clostridia bacterium]|nr:CBS domain-containing protein [Clostridia bacterium]